MAVHEMCKKLLILVVVILLTSCQPSVYVKNSYQDENSALIPLLLTKEELSEISNQFAWVSILSSQEQNVADPNTSAQNELSSRKYRGYYQTSDSYVTVWHTVTRYDIPIDTNRLIPLVGSVSGERITSSYVPDVTSSGFVISKCVIVYKAGQVCEVDIRYKYIESNIYISTVMDYGEKAMSNWLNVIISAVEPRIVLQDRGE